MATHVEYTLSARLRRPKLCGVVRFGSALGSLARGKQKDFENFASNVTAD